MKENQKYYLMSKLFDIKTHSNICFSEFLSFYNSKNKRSNRNVALIIT